MRRLIIGTLAGLVALAAGSATPATAKPPGANGQIVFARDAAIDEGGIIYTVNPDGSHEHQVLPLGLECPRWSPDGTRIATCGLPDGSSTVIINPHTGSYREVFSSDPTLFLACVVWSPNAKRLACDQFDQPADPSRNGIYTIRRSDGGGLRRVTSNPGGEDEPGAYSPNGKRLVFARFEAPNDPVGLYVVKVKGSHARRITPARTLVSSGGDWSAQGNEIVFSRHVTADLRSSLWVVHANGSGLHEIHVHGQPSCGGPFSDPTAKGCFDPHWSPDGKKIVFTRGDRTSPDDVSNIYTVNADGTGLTQVTHGGSDNFPDWGTHPLSR